ncbi:hypothetical protein ACIP2X_33375 [Streptomyces sp. NPDC089424]|uniref:hypothetical protein n=1 Tax=Streptomyces sp. NPDC089424 TaxID=3365917 RepID=UPI0038199171
MTRELQKFVKVYLSLEQAYDTTCQLRATLHSYSERYVRGVRCGLEDVLRARELTVGDYEGLTDIAFDDENTLYEYLTEMYRYLFEAGGSQPLPPD